MAHDPQLRQAMAEVEQVCKRYNCSGFVSLHFRTHGEFRYVFADWLLVRIVDAKRWHIKAYGKSKPVELNATCGFIWSLQDIIGRSYLALDQVKDMIGKHFQVSHEPFRDFEPFVDAAVSVVSEPEKTE